MSDSPQRTYGGPAASMSLLLELMRDAEDPGYRAAAEARDARRAAREDAAGSAGPDSPLRRSPWGSVLLLLVVIAVGALLAAAVLQTREQAPTVRAERDALLTRVDDATVATDALQDQIAALRAEIDGATDTALARTEQGRQALARLTRLETATGFSPATGSGVILEMDDAEPDPALPPEQAELGRVLDRDLQLMVNGLWQAGATAIAINGHRLTATSAIRSAGEAILVDYRPMKPPYVISAIGDPATLGARFTAEQAGTELATLQQDYGIRSSLRDADGIAVPAATRLRIDRAELLDAGTVQDALPSRTTADPSVTSAPSKGATP